MAEDKTPTNVVDEGIELYHSISKGGTVNKNFHAGTYNAALDRASQFYGGEQLYKIANDNLDFIQEQANDLVSELSQEVSFEKVEEFYEVTDGMVTREINITLPTGVEARFNIVAETSFNDLTVKFQDLDGYDGAEIYSETLDYIEYEPDNLIGVTSTIDITGDENVAEGLLDEIGLKSQAGDFNYKDGYDLYKVNIKPDANVVNIPNKAIFVEFGIEKEMSSDFIQGFIERPKVIDSYKNVTQIKIDGKTYDITDTFTSSQALQEHFKNADVLVYTNDIEDVGSKSYMFLNENSYVLEKIDDAQFNVDVANKYIKNNPYEKELKLARKKSFIEPERYQVLIDALLNKTDTPTNVVDDVVINKSEAIDNVNNLVDELPLEEAFKKQVKKNTARIGKNAATPGGIMDLIDSWELGVLVLAVAAISLNEVDEIPTILYNQGVKMYNNMLSSVGLPVQVEEKPYNINFEKAIETLNIAEMFMPTAYAEKALVKEFKKGQEAGIDISAGLGAGAGVPPMQFKTEEPKEDTGNINSIMTNLMSNISNAQKSYPITADEIGTFGRNPINVVPEDTKDKPVKVEYDSKEKQNLHDIYANLYTKLSNASARIE